MSRKIFGVTVGTTMNPKALKDKLRLILSVNGVKPNELMLTFEDLTDEQKASLKGPKGDDGVSPVVAVVGNDGGHRVTITDKNGAKTFDVMDGKAGRTPVNGVDYFTEAEKAEMVSAVIAALPVYNGEVVAV